MARPKKPAEETRTEQVKAKLTPGEKAALDMLVAKRGKALADEGIDGQGTFTAWLRAAIRREATAQGVPVDGSAVGRSSGAASDDATRSIPPKR